MSIIMEEMEAKSCDVFVSLCPCICDMCACVCVWYAYVWYTYLSIYICVYVCVWSVSYVAQSSLELDTQLGMTLNF